MFWYLSAVRLREVSSFTSSSFIPCPSLSHFWDSVYVWEVWDHLQFVMLILYLFFQDWQWSLSENSHYFSLSDIDTAITTEQRLIMKSDLSEAPHLGPISPVTLECSPLHGKLRNISGMLPASLIHTEIMCNYVITLQCILRKTVEYSYE